MLPVKFRRRFYADLGPSTWKLFTSKCSDKIALFFEAMERAILEDRLEWVGWLVVWLALLYLVAQLARVAL